MDSVKFPLSVLIMDDDFYALKGVVSLLSRDLRMVISGECNGAKELVKALGKLKRKPNIILVDAEYNEEKIPLPKLIAKIQKKSPESMIVCWSQYGDEASMKRVADAGVKAILIKKDVKLAIATHLVQVYINKGGYSCSVPEILGDEFQEWLDAGEQVSPWRPHPDLSPRLKQVFWLCIVYGMNVKAAAIEMQVQPETVERYRMKIYDLLEDGFANEAYLANALERIQSSPTSARGVNWAYHLLTQPPREDE